MNKTGSDAMLDALSQMGVSVCFANPGTTELDLVKAFENNGQMRCVLGLQENVCTGAADGYGRMAAKPAATLLHLGPGFANGIANLHNAKRAHTPIINIIGDHMSWHLPYDAPLSSDIESLAKPVSGWVYRIASVAEVKAVSYEAVKQTANNGGQSATLIFPADYQAEQYDEAAAGQTVSEAVPSDAQSVSSFDLDAFLGKLKQAKSPLFLLGGGDENSALSARGQIAVARICQVVNGRAFAETFPSRSERGQGLPDFDRLPYFPEPAHAVLDTADLVILAGALKPITYFGYVGFDSEMVDQARLHTLALPGEDAVSRLEQIAESLNAPVWEPTAGLRPAEQEGALNPEKIAATVARILPENAIVSVEGGTCGYPFYAASAAAARHTTLTNTGGAIGQGLPVAMGAAIACPDRTVLALLSDGSTQYTIQTLWTMAHEQLNVVVLIAANHQYAILRKELGRGDATIGKRSMALTDLSTPRIDWVGLANSYGLRASRAQTAEELAAQLEQAVATKGPTLIEMAI
ncbi:MAG: acetolactate synthase large subunit [Alcaligenaceae bacterium]|nr:acetolactate synthase large subunit [Alcaligenaceae bacterium]